MNLPSVCIKRPVFTIVLSLIICIIGLLGFTNLPVRWIPDVTLPTLTISTSYPGANATIVEQDVTKALESSLSGVDGIESMTSSSYQGRSEISVSFKLGKNMDAAVADVRSNIERVKGWLPADVDNPVVMKSDPNSSAIMYISFYDHKMSRIELGDYIDQFIVPAFETLDGMGRVDVFGKRVSALYVRLDPQKMAGANVTTDEVSQYLATQSVSIPSGQIKSKDRYYSVLTTSSLQSPDQFNNLILRDNNNQILRVADIGRAAYEAQDSDSAFRVDGREAIALGIVPQSNANPLVLENNVKRVFNDIKSILPDGMEAKIIYNQADYIRSSIKSVYESFFEAAIFVWLVIFVFLGSFRASVIPIITIPVCIISAFAILAYMGFSINTITLMALVLAIGLVVDDAIVMLENISRHVEMGKTPIQAAIVGSREMVFPVIAMTITLAAVYTPIAFTPGLLGTLFREFTFTLAGAVLVSGFVALTLTPMMCSSVLRYESKQTWMAIRQEAIMSRLYRIYESWLRRALSKRRLVIGLLLFIGVVGATLFYRVPSELAPQEDMNTLYVSMAAPRSASFSYTDANVKQMEAVYHDLPDIESYLSISGMRTPARAFQILMLKSSSHRQLSTADLMATISERSSHIAGVRVNVFQPGSPLAEVAGGDDGGSLGIVLMTSGAYSFLQQSSQKMLDQIHNIPGFVHADNSLKWDGEEFQVNIDQARAADLRVAPSSITNTISTLLAGRKLGKSGDQDIYLQMDVNAISNPTVFNQIYVRNADGKMTPLSSVTNIATSTSPEVYKHYRRLRSDMIYLTRSPDFKLSSAIKSLREIASSVLPDDVRYAFVGEAKSFLDSDKSMAMTFLLALIFIYLVLAAQFESFIDPLIIILTVPFAIIGAILTLWLFGGTLNIYSNIGLITLVGLIAKHGILITEFANHKREEGLSVLESVVQSALLRLRPIIMTTCAMFLGALPLAIAFGPGAENRQQIGLVITGGLLFGTIFSLIVVPVAYTLLAPFKRKIKSIQTKDVIYAASL